MLPEDQAGIRTPVLKVPAKGRDRLSMLLAINNLLIRNRDFSQLFRAVSQVIQQLAPHDYSSICLYDPEIRQFRLQAVDFPINRGLIREEVVFPVMGSPAGKAFKQRKPLALTVLDDKAFPSEVTRWLVAEGIRSACWIPLVHGEESIGVLSIGRLRQREFTEEELSVLCDVGKQITIAVENALAFREITELKEQLSKERDYLQDEVRSHHNYEEMVGESPAWKRVLQQIETVAPTDASVLILGETGTGKELVARAIHDQSLRRDKTFVKINCSAVPTGLLESELFGHERGAFTGAIAQHIGRFELANKGTLLLDEVGDISLELQPKLLRALQEQEFERLGSGRTIRVNVRVLASTNRDLDEMVANRQFREDLYYRLKVFPIIVPPLRERREDIPLLAQYFVHKYAIKLRRRIETISPDAMRALLDRHWPGNVRELENFIERAVILSQGPELQAPGDDTMRPVATNSESKTMEEGERELIVRTLRECGGIIAGEKGAAHQLGMKRTTLNSRMKKLGITRRDVLA